jgi:hypothetical protein
VLGAVILTDRSTVCCGATLMSRGTEFGLPICSPPMKTRL